MLHMDDLAITKLCAEAMGCRLDRDGGYSRLRQGAGMDEPAWFEFIYAPLHDDAQAMALVKKFRLHIDSSFYEPSDTPDSWHVSRTPASGDWDNAFGIHTDLNHAICDCVAKMQQNKTDA